MRSNGDEFRLSLIQNLQFVVGSLDFFYVVDFFADRPRQQEAEDGDQRHEDQPTQVADLKLRKDQGRNEKDQDAQDEKVGRQSVDEEAMLGDGVGGDDGEDGAREVGKRKEADAVGREEGRKAHHAHDEQGGEDVF